MSQLGPFELTHPELMSETELRAILKNGCIDFSKYEKLCRSELIDVYKRVVMPLPQRGTETDESNKEQKNASDCSPDKARNKPCSLKRNFSEFSKTPEASDLKRSKEIEVKNTARKICLNNAKCTPENNGIHKRITDRMNEEAQLKKRQKITWP